MEAEGCGVQGQGRTRRLGRESGLCNFSASFLIGDKVMITCRYNSKASRNIQSHVEFSLFIVKDKCIIVLG